MNKQVANITREEAIELVKKQMDNETPTSEFTCSKYGWCSIMELLDAIYGTETPMKKVWKDGRITYTSEMVGTEL